MALRKTLSEMVTAIRANLDEVAPSFWSVADIPQFVNRAKDRVAMEVRKARQDFFEVTRTSLDASVVILGETYNPASFRLVAGIRDYILPPDVATLVHARCLTSAFEGLQLAARRHTDYDFRRALAETTPQPPRFYALVGERTWRVAPTPDATYDFELTYVAVVPDLTSNASALEMPHPLYMAVEQYATAEALMKDHSPDAAAWEAKGNATIALFLGANERQETDTPVVSAFLEDW